MVTSPIKKTFTTKRKRSTSGVRLFDFPSITAVTVFPSFIDLLYKLTEVNFY